MKFMDNIEEEMSSQYEQSASRRNRMADFDVPESSASRRATNAYKEEMNVFDHMEKKAAESYNAQFDMITAQLKHAAGQT